MDIEQAVVKALGTAAPGKVSAAAAITGAAAPFIFYILHRDEAVEELDGDTALRAATFEVDAVGKGAKDLAELGAKVTAALKALRGTSGAGLEIQRARVTQESPDIKEREVNLWRRVYALRINYLEV